MVHGIRTVHGRGVCFEGEKQCLSLPLGLQQSSSVIQESEEAESFLPSSEKKRKEKKRNCCYFVGMMERSSAEGVLQNSHEERKLYAVDSLNNLNEQSICVDRSPQQRFPHKTKSAKLGGGCGLSTLIQCEVCVHLKDTTSNYKPKYSFYNCSG
ncbi:Leucine-rich single-pass membrane protein 1 [Varanus komodoensis]|nr:Leucine-rich single-pass membrane protein 1 [Varanus komodoensis]